MSVEDQKLMQYFDGELSELEGHALESQGLGDDAMAKLAGLERLAEVVREQAQWTADDAQADLDGLWSRIDAALDEEDAVAAQSNSSTNSANEGEDIWSRLQSWWEERFGYVMTGALSAAVTAVVVLFFAGQNVKVVEKIVVKDAPRSGATQEQAQRAEIEVLEVSDGSGTVFQVPGEGSEGETTVIWISREAWATEDSEGSI